MDKEQALVLLDIIYNIYKDQRSDNPKFNSIDHRIVVNFCGKYVNNIEYNGPKSRIIINYSGYLNQPGYMTFTFSIPSQGFYSASATFVIPYFKMFDKMWRRWRKSCSLMEKIYKNKEKIDNIVKKNKEQQEFNQMIHVAFPDEIDNILLDKDR